MEALKVLLKEDAWSGGRRGVDADSVRRDPILRFGYGDQNSYGARFIDGMCRLRTLDDFQRIREPGGGAEGNGIRYAVIRREPREFRAIQANPDRVVMQTQLHNG